LTRLGALPRWLRQVSDRGLNQQKLNLLRLRSLQTSDQELHGVKHSQWCSKMLWRSRHRDVIGEKSWQMLQDGKASFAPCCAKLAGQVLA